MDAPFRAVVCVRLNGEPFYAQDGRLATGDIGGTIEDSRLQKRLTTGLTEGHGEQQPFTTEITQKDLRFPLPRDLSSLTKIFDFLQKILASVEKLRNLTTASQLRRNARANAVTREPREQVKGDAVVKVAD